MWKEKEDSLSIQIQHSLTFFNFQTEIHDAYYNITLYYSYTWVQYLDVQTK